MRPSLLNCRCFFIFVSFSSWAWADTGFSIPTGWRWKNFLDSQEKRINVAHGAMDHIVHNISQPTQDGINGMDPWQSAALVLNIAMAELASNSTMYKDPISTVLIQRAEGWGFAIKTWGLACLYAYRAYRNSSLLEIAESAWGQANTYFITEEHASTGHHPERNKSIASTCNGHTSAGGVFFTGSGANQADTAVTPNTVAQFAALSGHLAEATNKDSYKTAARVSAEFVRNLLRDDSGLIYNSIKLEDCTIDKLIQESNSGFAMHAWSVVADVSQDAQWRNLAMSTLIASTITPLWTGDDGIVLKRTNANPTNANEAGAKGTYVSSFYEPWSRNQNDSAASDYIQAFIATQYHALRDLATSGSDYYSADWHGPKIDYWTQEGVMASTPVFAVAVASFPSSTASASTIPVSKTITTTGTSDPTPLPPRRKPIPAIIGGIIGGLTALSILLLCLVYRRHRIRNSKEKADHHDILGSELQMATGFLSQQEQDVHSYKPYLSRSKLRDGLHPTHDHTLASLEVSPRTQGTDAPPGAPNVPVDELVELVYRRLQAEHTPSGDRVVSTTSSDPVELAYRRLQAERPSYDQVVTERPLPEPMSPDLPVYTRQELRASSSTSVFRDQNEGRKAR